MVAVEVPVTDRTAELVADDTDDADVAVGETMLPTDERSVNVPAAKSEAAELVAVETMLAEESKS